MIRAVVLGGQPAGLAVVRSLGSRGVPVSLVCYGRSDPGLVSRFAEHKLLGPHPEGEEDRFVAALMDLGRGWGRALLIPTTDAALASVSRHKQELEERYIVACTDWDTTRKYIEKKYTYELADSSGVPAPRTVVPRSVAEVEQYGSSVQYPCLVKPTEGHKYTAVFGQKMKLVSSVDQMIGAYSSAVEAGLEVMLQEYIPGDDSTGANYNSYFWDGEPRAEFTAAKVRNGPPRTGSPRVARSAVIPEIIEPGRKILRAMGFYGFSCTEFKKDPRDGIYKLMEVNGRHNLSGRLAVRCGLDFPWLQYEHLVRGVLPSQQPYETGVYWIDIARDLGYSARYWRSEQYSLREYAAPYLGRRVFALLDVRDPMPFAKRLADGASTGATTAIRMVRSRFTNQVSRANRPPHVTDREVTPSP